MQAISETYLRSSSFLFEAQPVSYQLIYYLARGVDEHWKDLGRTLGLSVRTLSEINRKTELLDHEKGMTMLQEWKMRLGDDATVEVLQAALKDLGIKDPALKLKAGMQDLILMKLNQEINLNQKRSTQWFWHNAVLHDDSYAKEMSISTG